MLLKRGRKVSRLVHTIGFDLKKNKKKLKIILTKFKKIVLPVKKFKLS